MLTDPIACGIAAGIFLLHSGLRQQPVHRDIRVVHADTTAGSSSHNNDCHVQRCLLGGVAGRAAEAPHGLRPSVRTHCYIFVKGFAQEEGGWVGGGGGKVVIDLIGKHEVHILRQIGGEFVILF